MIDAKEMERIQWRWRQAEARLAKRKGPRNHSRKSVSLRMDRLRREHDRARWAINLLRKRWGM